MKLLTIGLLVLGVFIFVRRLEAQEVQVPIQGQSVYDFKVKTIEGTDKSLADYK